MPSVCRQGTSATGYGINLFAVPALALAGNWPVAAALVIAERVGRAIRKPTVESMLSYTTGSLGKGWVYGLNTALDEIGATIGPLVIALVLFLDGSYRTGYALLLVPTVLALVALTVARLFFPQPSRLEAGHTAQAKGFTASYWLYMLAGACLAAGLMSFEFISYHLARTGVVTQHWIPIFLAVSTGIGVVASLVFGKMYDRLGLPVVLEAQTHSIGLIDRLLVRPCSFGSDYRPSRPSKCVAPARACRSIRHPARLGRTAAP
jgi:predicted MFS family arabinose efflux permease